MARTYPNLTDTETLRIDRRRFLGATAVASTAVGGASSVATAATDTVSIVHDTHFHGRFERSSGVNIAQYTRVVNELRDANPNAGFVGIGDDFSPSTLGFEFHGEHMVEALNYLDPVVDGCGNHDFDFGVENASKCFQNSTFPWVVANLFTPDGNPIPGTKRWHLEDIGGHTIGFFGSGVEDFHGITAYPDDYRVIPPVDAAEEAANTLRENGADLVVMASHTNSSTHDDIAENADVDAIVGSHSDKLQDEVRVVNGTVISELGDQFAHLGVVQLDAASGDVVNWERHDLSAKSDSIPEDAGMRKIMDKWLGRLDDRLGQTVFRTARKLDARFSTNYAVESNFGDLVCDVMREEMDAEIGLQNPGGIRSGDQYGPGAITGKALMDTLETSVSALPWSAYGVQAGAQVSGLQYEFTGTGESVVGNFYVDGEPLREDETYTLATNDYVFENWDGLGDATFVETSKEFLGSIFIDHLSDAGVVQPDTENRILRVDEDVGGTAIELDESRVTAVLDKPETAGRVYEKTFVALTEYGPAVGAETVRDRGDAVAVTFDYRDLELLATGPKDVNLRVFGGFEPDDAAYDYRRDGALVDLPVAEPIFYFTMKGRIPTNGRGPNPFGGTAAKTEMVGSADSGTDDHGRRRKRHSHHH